MKATRFIASALTLGTMMVASAAAAQGTGGAGVQFGVSGGVTVPTGDLGDAGKTGFNVGAMLGFNPAAIPFGLRADVGYNQLDFKDDVGADGNWKILGGSLNAIFKLPATSVSPYLIGGVGVHNVKPDVEESELGESSTGFSLGGGAGLQFNLSGMASILEAKYTNVFTDEDKFGSSSAGFFTVSFGVLFGNIGGTASGSRIR